MQTRKLIIISIIAIVVLNLFNQQLKKNFTSSVLEAIKQNPEAIKTALGGAVAPAPEAKPDEEEQFKKQLADKANVDIGSTPVLGKSDAQIMIVVFSDFQCPFSKRGTETIHALIAKYGDKVNFVYKNLPLSFHPEATPAAKAALAAGKQGKFYEYHDKLYENQGSLGEDLYVQTAKDLGLNLQKFNADRNSKEIEEQITKDTAQANSLGFNGTPGFTLNGVKILGAYPIEHFE